MIFVTVGTFKFDKLVRKIDEIAKNSKEEFLVQIGKEGGYEPKNCRWFRMDPSLTMYFKKADLVVTHGGAGTLFECLNLGVRIVAVPNEGAKDSHQMDLISELERRGYILSSDLNGLENAIKSKEKLKKYVKPKCEIGNVITDFLTKKR